MVAGIKRVPKFTQEQHFGRVLTILLLTLGKDPVRDHLAVWMKP
jgi:hypothetical protein